MMDQELDRLLQRASAQGPEEPLPGGFTAGVLEHALRAHRVARAHWRSLVLGSFASLFLAIAIAIANALASRSHQDPPPLTLYRASVSSSPLSVR